MVVVVWLLWCGCCGVVVVVVLCCVVVVVVGVVLVVGFPGCMVVVPGVLGFGLGDVLVSSLGVYARELQGSVRRKTQRR